jgi:peptidoglycan/LPS O-acetylase OafA/YrhL
MTAQQGNNFNFIRIIAALSVLISHAYPIAVNTAQPEPLASFLPGYTLGRLAVWTFFIISGFFVSQSFARRKSVMEFCVARVLRIYPGLLTVLFLSAFVMGPLFTKVSIHEYFETMVPTDYVLKGLTFNFHTYLPGVFINNPYRASVNGSLWTLYYEVVCYGMIVIVGIIAGWKRFAFATFLVLYLCLHYFFLIHMQHDPQIIFLEQNT